MLLFDLGDGFQLDSGLVSINSHVVGSIQFFCDHPACEQASVLAMGRVGFDKRDVKEVEKVMGDLMVPLERGQTTEVNTRYSGKISRTSPPDKVCLQFKCLYCPWKGPGDIRRRARHFLPTGLPKSFWDTKDHAGIALCGDMGGTPPADLVDKFAGLQCPEFLKAKAFLSGQPIDGMHTRAQAGEEQARKTSELSLPRFSTDDEIRYRADPTKTRDVARLLCWAFWDADIPEVFIDNKYLKLALQVLQDSLVGHQPFHLPCRQTMAKMRAMEAKQAASERSAWMDKVQYGTVCFDARKMHEGRFKEHLMNSAVTACGSEYYLSSADMSGEAKDGDNTAEFVEAGISKESKKRNADGNIVPYKFTHPAPEVNLEWVVAITLDQPNTNISAQRALEVRHPTIAQLPCAFHGLDNLLGRLMKKVIFFKRATQKSKRLTYFCGNQSRVRSALTSIIKRRSAELQSMGNRKARPRFYCRVRNSRHYPLYFCVKRAYELNHPACTFFSSQDARLMCGDHKHYKSVMGIAVTGRGRFLKECKLFARICRPVMKKLRKMDSVKNNAFPNLMLHLVDLRGTLTNKWLENRAEYGELHQDDDTAAGVVEEDFTKDKQEIEKQVMHTCKNLATKWALAAFLLEPRHVLKFLEERRAKDSVELEQDWNPLRAMPQGRPYLKQA